MGYYLRRVWLQSCLSLLRESVFYQFIAVLYTLSGWFLYHCEAYGTVIVNLQPVPVLSLLFWRTL